MNRRVYPAMVAVLALLMCGCVEETPRIPTPYKVRQINRLPFYFENPESRTAAVSVTSEEHRLSFFGWGEQTDKAFTMQLPDDVSSYNRVLLEYRMGAWEKMPGEWDNTTMLFVENKDGERFEIARAITPYGNSFGSLWSKTFWLDVTEYLPMLQGETTFYLYYGGWDATDKRAHTVTVTFHYYKGKRARNTVFVHKLYDSSRDGNSGYRAWCYGVAGYDIEAEERLGLRTIEVPENVKSLELRVAITGHGHDQGKFVERVGYRTKNAAEFDENYYKFVVNGEQQEAEGYIFYDNSTNYKQAGTYLYDRANWAPGNPINVQYWSIEAPAEGYGTMTLDINLDKFESKMTEPNAEGVAQYITEVFLFGFDK
ncbi:MAG: hypothetical protein E7129_04495 [Rikenellaceae bacterium]|nr:hypothetical protein [Rikenellaceae bacterium]